MHSTDSAAEGRKRRLLAAFRTHALRNPFQYTITHRPRRFRGDVPRRYPGSTGGYDQPHFAGEPTDGSLDSGLIVRNNLRGQNREPALPKQFSHRRARLIGALAAGTGIADRDHS